MKRLLLIRHAEAASTPPGGTDHDRPLTAYGARQGEMIGRLIAEGTLPRPDLVLCSDAVRARQTWDAAAASAGIEPALLHDRALYGGTADTLVDLVRLVPDSAGVVAIVAHAPDVPALAAMVADARPLQLPGWSPATVGLIEFDGGWNTFPDADTRLVLTLPVEPPDAG